MTEYERALGLFGDSRADAAARSRALLLARLAKAPWLFIVVVAMPTFLAAVYYLLIAAPIYVSEAQFVVRSPSHPAPLALGSVLQTVGLGGGAAETDAYEVHEYMLSRDAVRDLARYHHLRALLDRPEADFLARFPRPFEHPSFENLFFNYKRFVTVGYDGNTGISTLRVEGFRPQDAHEIAEALLEAGEGVVNRLNDRAVDDAVAQARRQVTEAETQSLKAQAALTAFRNRERMIDPDKSSVADLELMGKLESELANMRAERAGLAASAPNSPQLPSLDKRIAAFQAQVDAERLHSAGADSSLAPKIGEYEQLALERDLSVKTLGVAIASLETARIEARRKQLYLERVVTPNVPDKAERPLRWLAVLMVAVSSLALYAMIALVGAGLREHQQH
jgi:capsular polysaccharide transport system permease protein